MDRSECVSFTDVDQLTNCLIDNETHEEVDTFVRRIYHSFELRDYNESTNWYIDWSDWSDWDDDVRVYALQTFDEEVQGLVAIGVSTEYDSSDLLWSCAAPHNNPEIVGSNKKYDGVGGHLIAIAAKCSLEWGYNGAIIVNAASESIALHYQNSFNAMLVAIRHPYHMTIQASDGRDILEHYSFILEE